MSRVRPAFMAGTLVVLLLGGGRVPAAEAERPRWEDLTPAEREEAWRSYEKYQQLPEERREFLERRYDRYRDMTKEERRRLRRNYDRYRDLQPGERRRFNQGYRQWKSHSNGPAAGGAKEPKRKRRAR